MTSLSDRPSVRPPLYVSQCEMSQSIKPSALNPHVFGGKWDGQHLLGKQTKNLKKSYSCIRWICRQTTYSMLRKQASYLKPESDWENEQTGEISVENKHVVSKQLASRIEIKCIFAGNFR